jgi:hypothetical protein
MFVQWRCYAGSELDLPFGAFTALSSGFSTAMSMAVHRTLGSLGQIRHELDLPGNLDARSACFHLGVHIATLLGRTYTHTQTVGIPRALRALDSIIRSRCATSPIPEG